MKAATRSLLPRLQKQMAGPAAGTRIRATDERRIHEDSEPMRSKQKDVASSVLNSLSGSFQITPMFFVNWKNGVDYNLVAQTPQYRIQSIKDIQNIPIAGGSKGSPEILADVASTNRGSEVAIINHYNIRRMIDIYGTPQDRDLGAVSGDVQRIVSQGRL
jgi:multidrug efflux pump subunit AcrB